MKGTSFIQPIHMGQSKNVKYHFICTFFVMTIAIYCSTGTLAPYANTLNLDYPGYPTADSECQYLYNGDYNHFEALFRLLDGEPREAWNFSVLLRRILYNILAYPLMKLFGHDLGGIITNLLLTWIAFITFTLFILRTVGIQGAVAGMWLLALYPGITYYVGQPFLYAFIVPGSLWLYMLLWLLERSDTARSVGLISLSMGVLFTGYDFIVFFGLAAIMLLLLRKQFLHIPLTVTGLLLPSILWWGILRYIYAGSFRSNNTHVYSIIIKSYVLPKDYDKWFELLKEFPGILLFNFFFSCFLFLPMLFLLMLFIAVLMKRQQYFTLVDITLLGSIFLIFLGNNLAPPYDGWQMRGTWIARLYQPIFVVLVMSLVRMYHTIMHRKNERFTKWLAYSLLVMTLVGNGVVAFGPILNDPWRVSSQLYWRFYQHSDPESMQINLEKYGRRPLGFCRRQP
jgi:hypothetical protein